MGWRDLWKKWRGGDGYASLASSTPSESPKEIGAPGLKIWGGWLSEAYNTELRWPECIPIYTRIWRSDPECSLARMVLESLASSVSIGVELPEISGPGGDISITDDDRRARDFVYQVLDDLEGGIVGWLESCVGRVPFFGWGWWEVVPGVRRKSWRGESGWSSQFDDGLIGYQKFAFRHYSSFESWHLADEARQIIDGFIQRVPPNPSTLIPLDRSVHIRFGDVENPEGLATLEAVWRLERIKYGLELVNGIGFEHAAGYLDVTTDKPLTDQDRRFIRDAARAIMTAQEGNYAIWPSGFRGDLKDVTFQAAPSLLDAIRYYGLLKLALFGVQWAALGTLSSYGTYSTMQDATSLFLITYNSMIEGFIRQLDMQVGKRLFQYAPNAQAFPGRTRRPRIVLQRGVEKKSSLADLGQFLMAISSVLPLGDEDIQAIRRASGILSSHLPEEGRILAQTPLNPNAQLSPQEAPSTPARNAARELAWRRPLTIPENEEVVEVEPMFFPQASDVDDAVRSYEVWAKTHRPGWEKLLQAQVEE